MFIEMGRSTWRTPAGCNVGHSHSTTVDLAHCTPVAAPPDHVSINIAPTGCLHKLRKFMLLPERRRCHTKHSPAGALLHEDYRFQTVTLPAAGDLHDWLSD